MFRTIPANNRALVPMDRSEARESLSVVDRSSSGLGDREAKRLVSHASLEEELATTVNRYLACPRRAMLSPYSTLDRSALESLALQLPFRSGLRLQEQRAQVRVSVPRGDRAMPLRPMRPGDRPPTSSVGSCAHRHILSRLSGKNITCERQRHRVSLAPW